MKIWRKSITNFLSYAVHKQTNVQTDKHQRLQTGGKYPVNLITTDPTFFFAGPSLSKNLSVEDWPFLKRLSLDNEKIWLIGIRIIEVLLVIGVLSDIVSHFLCLVYILLLGNFVLYSRKKCVHSFIFIALFNKFLCFLYRRSLSIKFKT